MESILLDVSGKAKVQAGTKRSASPNELHASKRGRTSAERRGSFDSISSISDSSLDRTGDKDDDVILVRSHSRSLSPRNNVLVLIILCHRREKHQLFKYRFENFPSCEEQITINKLNFCNISVIGVRIHEIFLQEIDHDHQAPG